MMMFVLGVVGIILLAAGGVLLGTGLLMLILGGVHSVVPDVPALGFWQTLPFALLLSFVGGVFSR